MSLESLEVRLRSTSALKEAETSLDKGSPVPVGKGAGTRFLKIIAIISVGSSNSLNMGVSTGRSIETSSSSRVLGSYGQLRQEVTVSSG